MNEGEGGEREAYGNGEGEGAMRMLLKHAHTTPHTTLTTHRTIPPPPPCLNPFRGMGRGYEAGSEMNVAFAGRL